MAADFMNPLDNALLTPGEMAAIDRAAYLCFARERVKEACIRPLPRVPRSHTLCDMAKIKRPPRKTKTTPLLGPRRIIRLSPEDQISVALSVLAPPAPSAALKRAKKAHRRLIVCSC